MILTVNKQYNEYMLTQMTHSFAELTVFNNGTVTALEFHVSALYLFSIFGILVILGTYHNPQMLINHTHVNKHDVSGALLLENRP